MTNTNHGRSAISLAIAAGFAVALSGCGGGSDSSSAAALTPAESCAALLSTTQSNVRITSATIVAATTDLTGISASNTATHTGPMPAHCLVRGVANERTGADGNSYAIGFEVRMPTTTWNGRFFFQGGGGSNGFLATAFGDLRGNQLDANGFHTDNALNRGFAVATTDGGHQASATSTNGNAQALFGMDPQARLDYGYNAVVQTTSIAKNLISKFYGKAQDHSYFVGCSNGGRDAIQLGMTMDAAPAAGSSSAASRRVPSSFQRRSVIAMEREAAATRRGERRASGSWRISRRRVVNRARIYRF